jgi:large subunit ribosomal protein L25
MERVSLEAKRRDGLGSGKVKKLRRTGMVPAIVYGRGIEPTPVTVEAKSLRSILHTAAGMNVLIDLAIGDSAQGGRTVMVKDLQRDIFRRDIIHVDFNTIDLTEKVEAHVPLMFKGQATGVVDEGGIFEVHLREIVVECLPTQIPEHIEVDISALTLGHSLHVRDVAVPGEVTLVSAPEEVVATVVAPKEEVVAPTPVPEAAAVPGAEAVVPGAEAGAGTAAPSAQAPEEKGKPEGKAEGRKEKREKE